jgi:iron-sulfur cluster repair protein YtfE (RIC family)
MNRITTALLGEHGVFYALFDHLEGSLEDAHCAGQVKARAGAVASALIGHARVEEQGLFQALEAHAALQGPLAMMRLEHSQIEEAFERIQTMDDLPAVQQLARQIIGLARQHFLKEEQVIFPFAGRVLDESASAALGEQWAVQRGVNRIKVHANGGSNLRW